VVYDLRAETRQVIRGGALLCCTALLAAACGPPIEARHVGARPARRVVASNALTTGEISRRTNNLLSSTCKRHENATPMTTIIRSGVRSSSAR
jgi:hypothetical protein